MVLVALVGYFLSAIGPAASIIGMLLALLPLAGVLLAVRLVDRWEPEPMRLLVFAVAWGAIAAVGIALGVDLLITMVFGYDDSPAREAFTAVVQAPIVEEVAKGLGVFLIFVSARRVVRRAHRRDRLRRTGRARDSRSPRTSSTSRSASSRAVSPMWRRRSSCAASSRRSRM